VGRPYEAITRSTSLEDVVLLRPGEDPVTAVEQARSATGVSFAGTAEQLAERIQEVVDAGVNYVLISFPRIAYDHEPLQRFAAEVIPQFSGA
jgi:alkanesulfonate monooxygenase SsuD/methylene tetrahydromethanopterin reductase-like flavin-dependent oxidoreductase (luciferase family)